MLTVSLKAKRLFLTFCVILISAVSAMGQSKINGTVITNTGEKLAGATVMSVDSQSYAITDNDGKFTIDATSGTKLNISFIGFITQVVEASQNMEVVLQEDTELLSEVVVTGYMAEKKTEITGAVAVVDMKDIASIPASDAMSVLQGRVPGMYVSIDGTPGGGNTSVLVRGTTTINTSTPLYVIDGMPTRDNISTILSPSDIKSIQVLKDAASASIYGTQAANGVIIITTNKADEGKTRVNFNASLSYQTYTTPIDLLNTDEWGQVYWQAYKNDGRVPNHPLYGGAVETPKAIDFIDSDNRIPAANTNWLDEVYNNAWRQDYNISLQTGSKRSNTILSLNVVDEDGLVKYTNFTRYGVRLQSNFNFLNNKLRIGENVSVNHWSRINAPGGIHEVVIKQHPIVPVKDLAGYFGGPTTQIGDAENPVRLTEETRDNQNKYWRIFGNIYAEIEPIKNLVLRSQYSLNYNNSWVTNYDKGYVLEGDRSDPNSSLTVTAGNSLLWNWSNTITYRVELGRHAINALAGIESKKSMGLSLRGYGENFLSDELSYRYLSNATGNKTVSSSASANYTTNSIFGKINYSYDDRYLFSATLRRDASSRFGANNNYGLFPAASVGWRISKEPFMKNAKWLDDLKIRASWGKNGNDAISNTATYTLYSVGGNNAMYDLDGTQSGTIFSGIYRSSTGNPNIGYEVTTQTNVGLDFSALKGRLMFTFDWFDKETTGMLRQKTQAAIAGEGTTYWKNSASMDNTGVEMALTWRDSKGDFSYDITLTGMTYKNTVTYLDESDYYTWGIGSATANVSNVGYSMNSWRGYEVKGLIRNQADLDEANATAKYRRNAIGRMWFVDQNGDNEITTADQVYLGTSDPKFEGGLNISLGYKGFDAVMYFMARFGDVYNSAKFYTDFFSSWTGNHGTNTLNAFHEETNPNSNIPKLTTYTGYETSTSNTYFIEDGSFFKFKSFQLGYTLPSKVQEKLKISNCRIYIQAQNLFCITKYSGADPELPGYSYPIPTNYTLGLNLSF